MPAGNLTSLARMVGHTLLPDRHALLSREIRIITLHLLYPPSQSCMWRSESFSPRSFSPHFQVLDGCRCERRPPSLCCHLLGCQRGSTGRARHTACLTRSSTLHAVAAWTVSLLSSWYRFPACTRTQHHTPCPPALGGRSRCSARACSAGPCTGPPCSAGGSGSSLVRI